jgi:hypothetical protein
MFPSGERRKKELMYLADGNGMGTLMYETASIAISILGRLAGEASVCG